LLALYLDADSHFRTGLEAPSYVERLTTLPVVMNTVDRRQILDAI